MFRFNSTKCVGCHLQGSDELGYATCALDKCAEKDEGTASDE
jgi:hypothetical protein